jgi:hypothetical protein
MLRSLIATLIQVTCFAPFQGWTALFEATLGKCMHGASCAQGRECTIGARLTRVTMCASSYLNRPSLI